MEHYKLAADIIKKFEGFTPKAVWDVNAYRLGYGSDTITLSNGTFRKVLKTDVTNQANATLDLIRRIKEFEKKVQIKVGPTYWNALNDKVKAALLSLAYNYGNITKAAIIAAIKTGNSLKIADAIVTSTAGDNKKLSTSIQNALKQRRQAEAAIVRNAPNANVIMTTAKGKIIPILLALVVGALLLR